MAEQAYEDDNAGSDGKDADDLFFYSAAFFFHVENDFNILPVFRHSCHSADGTEFILATKTLRYKVSLIKQAIKYMNAVIPARPESFFVFSKASKQIPDKRE